MFRIKMKDPFTSLLVFALWSLMLVLLVYLSVQPSSNLKPPFAFQHSDKIYHGVYYGLLMIVSSVFLRQRWQNLITGIFLVNLGILLEFAQQAVPGRFFSPADMMANTAGVALAFFLLEKRGRDRAS